VSVGGVTGLTAATKPGHASSAGTSPPAGTDDSPGGILQAPAAAPTAPQHSPSGDDDGQAPQPAHSASAPHPQPAPSPPPVSSGGS
jgi:hypothetical protein